MSLILIVINEIFRYDWPSAGDKSPAYHPTDEGLSAATRAYLLNGSSLDAEHQSFARRGGLRGTAAFFPKMLCFFLAINYAEDAFGEGL
jgi:hypothetical protein